MRDPKLMYDNNWPYNEVGPERTRSMNSLKLQFALEKETKGAVRYQELDVNGGVAATFHIGNLYLRKTSLPSTPPARLEIEVKWS